MIAAASSPHQMPRIQDQRTLVSAPGSRSRLPPITSQTLLIEFKSFMFYRRNRRLKKNKAVGRSMQKNAQPKFTIRKVSAQPQIFPATVGGPPWFFLHSDQKR